MRAAKCVIRSEALLDRVYNVKVTLGKSDLLWVSPAGCDLEPRPVFLLIEMLKSII